MTDKRRISRKVKPEFADYIGLVDRTVLSYSINHYQMEGAPLHPYSRSLYLYGKMLWPTGGAAMNALLMSDPTLAEAPTRPLGDSVGSLHKHRGEYQFFANVPLEFVSTLSGAYSAHRLQLIYGRGAPLFHGRASLSYIGFHERSSFEEQWGEPLDG